MKITVARMREEPEVREPVVTEEEKREEPATEEHVVIPMKMIY